MNDKPRILLIDDEPAILRVWRSSLRQWEDKYEILTAQNGYAALQIIQQKPCDLVVTDYRMPDMDGLELMSAIYADYPETRVILITAYGSDSLKQEAGKLNAWRYLLKPVDINVFRQVVREALEEEETPSTGRQSGLLILSEARCQEIGRILEQLQTDVGAHVIILADANGQVVSSSGETPGFQTEEVASLLSGSMATLQAAGEVLDRDTETINLAYREGPKETLYAINVGRDLLLIIVIENTLYSSKLGATWYYARQTAANLRDLLQSAELENGSLLLNANIDDTLDDAFDKLFDE